MEQPPRKPTEAILSVALGLRIVPVGLIIAAGSLAACLWGLRQSAELAQSMTLTTLIVLQLVRVQMVRSAYHMPLFSNRWLVAALLSSFLLQLGVLYAPGSHMVFGTVALGTAEWSVILLIAFLVWWAGVGVNGVLGGWKSLWRKCAKESEGKKMEKERSFACPAIWFSGFFGLGALVHLVRLLLGFELVVAGFSVPMKMSLLVALVLGAFSIGLFVLGCRKSCCAKGGE